MSIQTLRPRAKVFWTCCIVSMSLCLPSNTFAQDSEPPPPPSAAPTEMPPPPPEAPPQPESSAPAAAPAPDGQWVFTAQYGWVFMPYADNYTYMPSSGIQQLQNLLDLFVDPEGKSVHRSWEIRPAP